MGIGWVNSEGKAGYSENAYDYAMEIMDNFRYTDQQRTEESFNQFSPAQQKNFETKLTADEETKFQDWKQQYAPKDSGYDYDLRGAYLRGFTPDPETQHWPDTFKKPWHETFSNESVYATDAPGLAGFWSGPNHDRYTPGSDKKGTPGQVPALGTPGQSPVIQGAPGEPGQAPADVQETATVTIPKTPDFSKWPTDIDVGISRGNDLSYGDKSAPYINYTGWDKNAAPKMKSLSIEDVAKVFNSRQGDYATGKKDVPITPEHSEQIHEAWLVARRSPLAYLGFDLAKTSFTPPTDKQLLLGERMLTKGLTSLGTLESWYRGDSKTTLLHESIHRGYEKVLDSEEFKEFREKYYPNSNYPSQEDVTRALMVRHAGFVEATEGTGPAINMGLRVPSKYLDKIEEIASKMIAKQGKTHAEIESMTHSKVATNEPNPVTEVGKSFWREVLGPTIAQGIINPIMASGPPMLPGFAKLPKAPSLPKNSAAKDVSFPSDPTKGQLGIYYQRIASILLDEGSNLKAVNKATGIPEEDLKFMRDKRSLAASSIWGETPLHELYRQRSSLDVKGPIKPSELKDFAMKLNSSEIESIVKKMPPEAIADFERQLARNTLLNEGASKKAIMDFMFPKKIPTNKRSLIGRLEEAAIKAKDELK